MGDQSPTRSVVPLLNATLRPYDRYGKIEPGMHWLPINYDKDTGGGNFLLRLDPGAQTMPHTHSDLEELLVLDGELIESDGQTFGPGDHISYPAGSQHFSRTHGGCLIFVQVKGLNKLDRSENAGS